MRSGGRFLSSSGDKLRFLRAILVREPSVLNDPLELSHAFLRQIPLLGAIVQCHSRARRSDDYTFHSTCKMARESKEVRAASFAVEGSPPAAI